MSAPKKGRRSRGEEREDATFQRRPRRGIAPRGHDAMVSAIWGRRGEFALNMLNAQTTLKPLVMVRRRALERGKCTNLLNFFQLSSVTSIYCTLFAMCQTLHRAPMVLLHSRFGGPASPSSDSIFEDCF